MPHSMVKLRPFEVTMAPFESGQVGPLVVPDVLELVGAEEVAVLLAEDSAASGFEYSVSLLPAPQSCSKISRSLR